MPHREQKHLDELSKSLEKSENHSITNIVLTGDFNCPDIRWDTQTACGPDREIQQGLSDLMGANNLTQIHDSPTRENNLLDLVFVSNRTLVKSSVNVPGISDHEIIITDFETKVHHQNTTPRKCYIYRKANWNTINKDLNTLNEIVEEKQRNGADVHQLWDNIFKKHLFGTMNNNIPNKEIKSRNNIPWVKRKERKMLKNETAAIQTSTKH
jgi:hypothetical protein